MLTPDTDTYDALCEAMHIDPVEAGRLPDDPPVPAKM
jgi:hypothetical protein